ncbi:hypothetical protein D3C86_2014610 [compost metagenome]
MARRITTEKVEAQPTKLFLHLEHLYLSNVRMSIQVNLQSTAQLIYQIQPPGQACDLPEMGAGEKLWVTSL